MHKPELPMYIRHGLSVCPPLLAAPLQISYPATPRSTWHTGILLQMQLNCYFMRTWICGRRRCTQIYTSSPLNYSQTSILANRVPCRKHQEEHTLAQTDPGEEKRKPSWSEAKGYHLAWTACIVGSLLDLNTGQAALTDFPFPS